MHSVKSINYHIEGCGFFSWLPYIPNILPCRSGVNHIVLVLHNTLGLNICFSSPIEHSHISNWVHSKTPIPLVIMLRCNYTVTGQWEWSHCCKLLAAQWLITLLFAAQSPCCRQLATVTTLSSHPVVTMSSRRLIEKEFCCVYIGL